MDINNCNSVVMNEQLILREEFFSQALNVLRQEAHFHSEGIGETE